MIAGCQRPQSETLCHSPQAFQAYVLFGIIYSLHWNCLPRDFKIPG
jgi:hypothetical protein